MGFDVLNCDNRFGDSEIPIVVLGFDKVLTWTKNSRNQLSNHCSFEEKVDKPLVEFRIIDMHSIWSDANDGAVFLMEFGQLFRHGTTEKDIVVNLITVGQPSQKRAGNVSQRMKTKAVDG